MMGERTVMQEALFYSFSIEDHVPADNLLRSIDRFVDLEGIREHVRPYYSDTGRPSIDPELMIRMLIVGYCMGIRSERRLCEEVHLNLAYRWFCRLGLNGAVPDHSTFSKNRHGRFRDSDLLRQLFEMTVERCMAEGLVGGEGFAVDASLIRADVPGSDRCLAKKAYRLKRLAAPSASIWKCWMMLRSAVQRRSRPSGSPSPILHRAGPRQRARRRSIPTAPTI